jgi:hypothetical protein
MAAAVHLATSAEILPRNAPIIPPGSYQQRVSSGLLCERKTLLKNPSHLTGINLLDRPLSARPIHAVAPLEALILTSQINEQMI